MTSISATTSNTTTQPPVVKRENPTKFAPSTSGPKKVSNKEFLKPYNVLSYLVQEEDAFDIEHGEFNKTLAQMAWYPEPTEVTGTTEATEKELAEHKIYLTTNTTTILQQTNESENQDEIVIIPNQNELTTGLMQLILLAQSRKRVREEQIENSSLQATSSSSLTSTQETPVTLTKKAKTKEAEPVPPSKPLALSSCPVQ